MTQKNIHRQSHILHARSLAAFRICRKKEASTKKHFESYLNMFGDAKAQFHLEEPIEVDGSIKSRAGKWLAEHPTHHRQRKIHWLYANT